jgi:hypothetical protein
LRIAVRARSRTGFQLPGELDGKQYAGLLSRVLALAAQRGELAQRIATLDRLADAAKGEEKRDLAALVSSAGALLQTVDGFIGSLKAGETGDRSPLFNAARYLGFAARTEGMLVLDFDLLLEGMTIVNWFGSLSLDSRLRGNDVIQALPPSARSPRKSTCPSHPASRSGSCRRSA